MRIFDHVFDIRTTLVKKQARPNGHVLGNPNQEENQAKWCGMTNTSDSHSSCIDRGPSSPSSFCYPAFLLGSLCYPAIFFGPKQSRLSGAPLLKHHPIKSLIFTSRSGTCTALFDSPCPSASPFGTNSTVSAHPPVLYSGGEGAVFNAWLDVAVSQVATNDDSQNWKVSSWRTCFTLHSLH